MELDPKTLQLIIETFKSELEDLLQLITDGLLHLEKDENPKKTIESIFRAAHTIKGGAKSVGVDDIGEIAHHIESLFSSMQRDQLKISPHIIDLCLEAVDSIRIIMKAFSEKKPHLINISNLIARLNESDIAPSQQKKSEKQIIQAREESPTKENKYESIRVSLENLDHVSSLMEEIQINKIAIDDHYMELTKLSANTDRFQHVWKNSLLKLSSNNQADENIDKLLHSNSDNFSEITSSIHQLQKNMKLHVNELETLFNSLQEEIRTLRLVPADTLLRGFPRLIRDLARELNKKVELDIKGGDVKMDKMMLEGLKDPLIHILRNAIDHGIESAELRKTNGKSEVGHITINIKDEGNKILFKIEDDGAGIDINKIISVAEQKNILSKSELESMTHNEILDLIFRPGFTTKSVINDVSGRGVGLDIVKSNVTHLKGQVNVESQPGKKTTLYVRVPLTLSSERGMIVISGGEMLVIPTSAVERVLILSANEILEVEATQAIMLDNHPVPLRNLANLLGFMNIEPADPNRLSVVVIKNGWKTVALLVNEIIGEKEIVIKSLHAPLINIPCVSGGTLSGNGQVIIVINANDLIAKAIHSSDNSRVKMHDHAVKPLMTPRILVVDDSITTRTLEKNILESKKYDVTVAVNGKEAWDLLQKNKFSLLITDIMMPIMDGIALTERVKSSDELRDLPVIIVTSLGSDAEKKRGIEAGANAYIVKSEFESGALLEIVSQLV